MHAPYTPEVHCEACAVLHADTCVSLGLDLWGLHVSLSSWPRYTLQPNTSVRHGTWLTQHTQMRGDTLTATC